MTEPSVCGFSVVPISALSLIQAPLRRRVDFAFALSLQHLDVMPGLTLWWHFVPTRCLVARLGLQRLRGAEKATAAKPEVGIAAVAFSTLPASLTPVVVPSARAGVVSMTGIAPPCSCASTPEVSTSLASSLAKMPRLGRSPGHAQVPSLRTGLRALCVWTQAFRSMVMMPFVDLGGQGGYAPLRRVSCAQVRAPMSGPPDPSRAPQFFAPERLQPSCKSTSTHVSLKLPSDSVNPVRNLTNKVNILHERLLGIYYKRRQSEAYATATNILSPPITFALCVRFHADRPRHCTHCHYRPRHHCPCLYFMKSRPCLPQTAQAQSPSRRRCPRLQFTKSCRR